MKTKRLVFITIIILITISGCINDVPDSISSDLEMKTSIAFPLGTTSLGLNEISGFNESLLDINPLTNEPYWAAFEEVDLSYSLPFDIGDIYKTTDEIEKIVFRLNIYNGFPANVKVQLYFQDEYDFNVDSLFSSGPLNLEPAKASGSGKILSRTYEKKDISFSPERIEALQWVSKVKVYVVFSTLGIDRSLVSFYGDYNIKVQIGVKANLRINIS